MAAQGSIHCSSRISFNAFRFVVLITLLLTSVRAYIPASPTNNTDLAIANGLNVTDISKLNLQWYNNGSYSQSVSYQLAGNGSQGVSKGALVHFSEEKVNNDSAGTLTPWIALVSCDFNATNSPDDNDIFTLARDKGAVAAVLYSSYSAACIINPEYADPTTFDQVFDIFSVQSLTSAHLLEYQFGQISQNETSLYTTFNSTRLNASYTDVTQSISTGYPVASGYLIGTLIAYNATGIDPNTWNPSGGQSSQSTQSGGHNTALAMIILYAITGCVSVLFCVVIVSGAIRAIRHPERYGPRAASRWNRGDNGQTRAQGLTRAILDTFPVVKFGSSPSPPPEAGKDIEHRGSSDPSAVEMRSIPPPSSPRPDEKRGSSTEASPVSEALPSEPTASSPSHSSPPAQVPASSDGAASAAVLPRMSREDVPPEAMGTETCPICIVDFEEGDDLRVLPCDGKHRFHQSCVDPWLLELSSACPICRHDFLALENIIAGDSDDSSDEDGDGPAPQQQPTSPSGETRRNRFTRYLSFARQRNTQRRRSHIQQSGNTMPTDP